MKNHFDLKEIIESIWTLKQDISNMKEHLNISHKGIF